MVDTGKPTEKKRRRGLSTDDKDALAEAIYLWRYVGHGISPGGLVPKPASERRRTAALRLAKAAGVGREYVRHLIAHPVLTIAVNEYE